MVFTPTAFALIDIMVDNIGVDARPIEWNEPDEDGTGHGKSGNPIIPTRYLSVCPHCGQSFEFNASDILVFNDQKCVGCSSCDVGWVVRAAQAPREIHAQAHDGAPQSEVETEIEVEELAVFYETEPESEPPLEEPCAAKTVEAQNYSSKLKELAESMKEGFKEYLDETATPAVESESPPEPEPKPEPEPEPAKEPEPEKSTDFPKKREPGAFSDPIESGSLIIDALIK